MCFIINIFEEFFFDLCYDIEIDKLIYKIDSLEIEYSIVEYLIYNKGDIIY